MATSGSHESFKDLLTCTICLETFKEPKYLPCLHTFCKSCIHTYIVSSVKEGDSEGFRCPVCRRLVQSGGTTETWAEQLAGNYFITSMLDKQAIQKCEKFCDGCKMKESSVKAISWCTVCEEAYCESCESCHKTFKISRNHKIISLKDVNAGKDASCLYGNVACNEHTDKMIEVYCKDHSKPCCTLCTFVNHRKCEQVITIDKAATGVKQSTKALKLSKQLKESSEKLSDFLKSHSEDEARFEAESKNVVIEIDKLKEAIIQHLNKMAQKLKDEMNTTKKQVTVHIQDQITELSSLKSTVDNWKNIFDACLSQGSELQCLVKMEEILEKKAIFDDELNRNAKNLKNNSVSFQPADVKTSISSIGRIHFRGSQAYSLKMGRKIDFHNGKVKIRLTIDVDVKRLGVERLISGIFWDSDIILTDQVNNRIIYYNDKGEEKETLEIDRKPTDITKIDNQTVAVSAYNANVIYLVHVKPLVLKSKLTIGAKAWGIRFVEDEYIVCSLSGVISWLNPTTGAKIREIETGTDNKFITCDAKNEYLYMNTTTSVKYESSSGNGFTYTNPQLDYPNSCDRDCDGNIYVLGFNSKNIHQLSHDGKLIRIIPLSHFTSITDRPWRIRFQDDSNRFLLTFHKSGKVLICEIDPVS